jgi:hypothetical protein
MATQKYRNSRTDAVRISSKVLGYPFVPIDDDDDQDAKGAKAKGAKGAKANGGDAGDAKG